MNNKQETNTTETEKAAMDYAEVATKTRPQIGWVIFDVKEAFKAGFTAGARSRDAYIQLLRDTREMADKEVERLSEENRKLRFMIDNGLGWEDLKNDVSYPNG